MLFQLIFIASIVEASEIVTFYSNSSAMLNSLGKPKTDSDEIHFLFFNRINPKQFKEIKLKSIESLQKSNYSFNHSSKIIIPGWISNDKTTVAIETLKDALVNKTNSNIIVVNWNKLASGQYKAAYAFSNTVAFVLIEFIKFMIDNGLSSKQLHLIGHSIGAHIAGIAGKYFRDQNKTIDAITGLDPAYPRYKFATEDERLDAEDAKLVEVIHTNGGFWGYRGTIGHIDFFPNGGRYQPGCCHDIRELCAHDRAIWYYAYSITGTKFVGIAIEFREQVYYHMKKRMNMGGLKLNYGKNGSYWLRTGHSPPFEFNPDDDVKQHSGTHTSYVMAK
ncbi:lipase domain-containing protein [Phthorimaea operculella]|nr:lipase domain-containing protein [Phthorimaea operculella]